MPGSERVGPGIWSESTWTYRKQIACGCTLLGSTCISSSPIIKYETSHSILRVDEKKFWSWRQRLLARNALPPVPVPRTVSTPLPAKVVARQGLVERRWKMRKLFSCFYPELLEIREFRNWFGSGITVRSFQKRMVSLFFAKHGIGISEGNSGFELSRGPVVASTDSSPRGWAAPNGELVCPRRSPD